MIDSGQNEIMVIRVIIFHVLVCACVSVNFTCVHVLNVYRCFVARKQCKTIV